MNSRRLLVLLLAPAIMFAGCASLKLRTEVQSEWREPSVIGTVRLRPSTATSDSKDSEVPSITVVLLPPSPGIQRKADDEPVIRTAVLQELKSARLRNFQAAIGQLHSHDKSRGPLPPELAKQPAVISYFATLSSAVRIQTPRGLVAVDAGIPEPSLSASDFRDLGYALKRVLSLRSIAASSAMRTGGDQSTRDFWKFFGNYLDAYVIGEFVDGLGGKIAKPQFTNGVGSDTIAAAETVLLELLADWFLQTPLFKGKDGKFIPAGEKTPTSAKVSARPILTAGAATPVTEKEAKGLACVSGLAGDGGLALAGVVFRSFGGLGGGPIIVFGKWSIGDNNTVMRIGETLFEVTFRRASEHLLYELLNDPSSRAAMKKDPQLECLLDLL